MNARETLQKWVAALRSGQYAQGRGALRYRDNTWCCLGVLADVSGVGKWSELPGWGGAYTCVFEEHGRYGSAYDGTLPEALLAELGMTGEDASHLVAMNDMRGASFSAIADEIENRYL